MSTKEFSWQTKDQLKIYAVEWSVEQPKAVIALVHGLGEHCRRYDHLARFFNDQGYAMLGYDRRGHGRSEGKRGHTTSYAAFLDEVQTLVSHCKDKFPDCPLFLYGHSMGGNLALNYLLQRQPKDIKGIVVTGAWIKLATNPPAFLLWLGKLMRIIYPAFTQPNGLDANHISTVKKEVDAYANDPLVHDKVTSATGIDMLKAGNFLATYRGNFSVPLLMMHGGEDKIIDPAGSRDFCQNVSGLVQHKEWPNLYHEIHNEANADEIFNFALQWMEGLST
ncbi:MAG: lysophospholipase [Bacteroidota bacterium]